jgi:hypothetical protein
VDSPLGIRKIQPPDVDGDMAQSLLWQNDDAQVDLALADGDWPFIAACSPDRVRALLDALKAAERERDANHAHACEASIEERQLREQLTQIREKLQDPTSVHFNLLRGDIAKPSEAQILHLYPEIEAREAALRAQVDRMTNECNRTLSERNKLLHAPGTGTARAMRAEQRASRLEALLQDFIDNGYSREKARATLAGQETRDE